MTILTFHLMYVLISERKAAEWLDKGRWENPIEDYF